MKIFVEMNEEEFDLYKKSKKYEGEPVYTQKDIEEMLKSSPITFLIERNGFESFGKDSRPNIYGHQVETHSYKKQDSRYITKVLVTVEEL